jgi:hypothetical protein
VDKEKLIEERITRLFREKFSFRFISLDATIARLISSGLEAILIGTIARCTLCKPSDHWLGLNSPDPKIRAGGLWLVQHLKTRGIDDHEKKVLEAALEKLRR